MDETEKAELIKMLKESHKRFVEGLLSRDGQLCWVAYRNYVVALGLVMETIEVQP